MGELWRAAVYRGVRLKNVSRVLLSVDVRGHVRLLFQGRQLFGRQLRRFRHFHRVFVR